MEEQCFPRARYWNELAKGMMALHFDDVPSLRSFTCPDGSHLDQKDKFQFTTALAREIKSRNWIARDARMQLPTK